MYGDNLEKEEIGRDIYERKRESKRWIESKERSSQFRDYTPVVFRIVIRNGYLSNKRKTLREMSIRRLSLA